MGVLNFAGNNLITGVNIIDGNLYWTDDNSEPKRLEIDKFKASNVTHEDNITKIDGQPIDHTDITVIRPHPFQAITLDLQPYEPGEGDPPEPPFEKIFPRFSYRWRYDDGQYSPYAPFTQPAFLPKERIIVGQPEISTSTRSLDGVTTTTITQEEILASHVENYVEGFNTTMINNVGTIRLENIPRGTRDVVAVDLLYTESISSTIYVLETIEIPESQRGLDFVLNSSYTTGVPQPEHYSLQPITYELSARKIYRALPANQLTRPFDNVPRLAKAQEITANRLVYGNYLQGYEQPSSVVITVNAIEADAEPYLFPNRYPVGTSDASLGDDRPSIFGYTENQLQGDLGALATRQHLLMSSVSDGLHVKGDRTYEIGVAYIDSFGRQGAMIQAGSILQPDGSVEESLAFRMPFRQFFRQRLVSQITSPAPRWADRYRYFIKEVSQDHHNLICYNIYNEGDAARNNSDQVWLEFQSTDRNKVQEGTIISPRRVNDDILEVKRRHLIKDIQNEAPDDVRAQLIDRTGRRLIAIGHPTINLGSTRNNAVVPSDGGVTFAFHEEHADLGNLARELNNWMASNDEMESSNYPFVLGRGEPSFRDQTIDSSNYANRLYFRLSNDTTGAAVSDWAEVNRITFSSDSIEPRDHRSTISMTLGQNYMAVTESEASDGIGMVGTVNPSAPIPSQSGVNYIGSGPNATGGRGSGGGWQVEFAVDMPSEAALERLQGRFWVKVARNDLETTQSQFDNQGEILALSQTWFETEPDVEDSQLDLFWESSQTFCVCTDHGWPNKIEWTNCVAEVTTDPDYDGTLDITEVQADGVPAFGVYLESTRINDRFNTPQLVKGVRVNVPQDRYGEERRRQGMIWSGIYNSRTGINRLNQFIQADGITKELEPNYGSLQKLHTRDTNVIAFCEDKVFRILADKDQLFNADGGGNVSSTNVVLGQTTPFVGEYGIGLNPESFASYGHNIYFADPLRGVICQLTPGNGQIFEISGKGMNDFFRDRLVTSNRVIGMFDDYGDKYIVSMQGYNERNPAIAMDDAIMGDIGETCLGYELDVEGWVSRYSFIPEAGLSLNNRFYTFKNGRPYVHNSPNVPRNHFYDFQHFSEVEIIFNDNPSAVKEFLTIGYEGSQERILDDEFQQTQEGWYVVEVDTANSNEVIELDPNFTFTRKEDKYFMPIVNTEQVYQVDINGDFEEDGVNFSPTGETRQKGGVKGFFNRVRLGSTATSEAELFAVNTENYISSN